MSSAEAGPSWRVGVTAGQKLEFGSLGSGNTAELFRPYETVDGLAPDLDLAKLLSRTSNSNLIDELPAESLPPAK